jgi:outer membrane protein assembly factor BamB
MRTRPSIAAAAIASLVAIGAASPAAASDPTPTFEQISPLPLDAITAPGSQVGLGADGEPLIFYVSSGSPAVFSVVDARTGERTFEAPMPGASGAWAVDVAPNGDVYVGSYGEGRLFRHTPGSASVEDLGQPIPGETFVWSITHDEEGRVYGGTGQFGGHVFRYDPETGATRDYGPVPDATNLIVRSITVADGTIYAGTGATPTIFAIDAESGQRTTIPLPPGAADQQYVYDLDARDGLLFARFSRRGSPEPLHVYDIAAERWIDSIDGAHGLFVSPVAEDGRTVYFVRNGTLHTYDLESAATRRPA